MSIGEYTTQLRIDATPAEVFPYLTDAALIVQWMGDWADVDPTVGGRFVLDINGIPIRSRYITVDPPSRLVFTWGTPGSDRMPPGSTTVEITLHEDRGGTLIELVHRQLQAEESSPTRHRLGTLPGPTRQRRVRDRSRPRPLGGTHN
jgi:uncharacterized protein YndB with AHSA1/START domain